MAHGQRSSMVTAEECKICNDPLRAKIEKRILSNKSFAEIVKEFPSLNKQNCSVHYRKHMAPYIGHKVTEALDKEAVERKDSIVEITNLITKLNGILDELLDNIDPEDDLYLQQLNAARGLSNSINSAIKLNMVLLGDTDEQRNLLSLSKLLQSAKKKMKAQEKSIMEITPKTS